MRIAITGASGLIGSRLVARLEQRGDEVTVLSRSRGGAPAAGPARSAGQEPAAGPARSAGEQPAAGRARSAGEQPAAGPARSAGQEPAAGPARSAGEQPAVVRWDPESGPAPAAALAGRDAVVHLAGEPVAQRWSESAKRRIRESRELGTRNLVAGIAAADPRPAVLVSSSAVGYYGPRGDEPVDEDAGPGADFLADVCVVWEREARAAAELGVRVVSVRTGVVLDRDGGALSKMLLPFRLGVGGPVAGGSQYMPWIHLDDVVGIYLAALDGDDWSGPVNATAPAPVTNRAFSKALGRALRRPAVLPIPGLAISALYGEMALIVNTGQRAVPARAQSLGYTFRHPDLDEALGAALAG